MAKPTVSAIVVSYWTGAVLSECLEALLAQEPVSEIIVVDNGNDAESVAWLQQMSQEHDRITVLAPGVNIGFSAGSNFGVNHSSGDYVALVNPDAVLAPDAVSDVLEVFRDHPNTWVCGGRLENLDGSEQRGGRRNVLTPWTAMVELLRLDRLAPNHPYFRRFHLHEQEDVHEAYEVPTVSGSFMVFPKQRYEWLGGLDDNLFLHLEDSEICLRILRQGGKVMYCGNVPVKHYRSTSDASRTFIEWHKARSSGYYFYKHFSDTFPRWFLILLSTFVWARFLVGMPYMLVGDIPGILRRWRRRPGRRRD